LAPYGHTVGTVGVVGPFGPVVTTVVDCESTTTLQTCRFSFHSGMGQMQTYLLHLSSKARTFFSPIRDIAATFFLPLFLFLLLNGVWVVGRKKWES
jgi:hypothetical protein